MRRLPHAALLATLIVPLAGIAAPAGATTVQPDCTASIVLPSAVTIRSEVTNVSATIAGCNGPYIAGAYLLDPRGQSEAYELWDESTTASDTIYDDAPAGSYRTQVDGNSYDRDDNVIGLHNDTTYVRFGTQISALTSRSGSVVTIYGLTHRYLSGEGYGHYPGVVVGIQRRVPGATTWVTIGYAKAGSDSRYSFRHAQPQTCYYRAFLGTTGSFAGSFSQQSAR